MSSTRPVYWVVALCLTLGVARAEPPPSEARRLFEEGKTFYGQGSHLPALRRFHRALELEQRASTHLMAARCYRRLHRPDLALHHYERHVLIWATKRTGASPHQEEVTRQIDRLKDRVERARRAEVALESRRWAAALELFHEVSDAGWVRVQRGLALCHEGLGQTVQARSSLTLALAELRRWRDAWEGRPPDQAQVRVHIDELEALEARLRGPGEKKPARLHPLPRTTAPASRHAAPAARPASRRTLWLTLGITAAALAVSAEATAWVAYSRATDYYEHETEYGRYRNLTVAGHAVAGTMAAAAVVSFYLYHRSGRTSEPGVAVLPTIDGGLVTAGFCF